MDDKPVKSGAKRQASRGVRFRTEKQVSEEFGLSPKTLQRWRLLGIGPRYFKLQNRAVRYDVADLERWIQSSHSGGRTAL